MDAKQLIEQVEECAKNNWKNSDLMSETERRLEIIADHYKVCEECADNFNVSGFEAENLIDFIRESNFENTELSEWICGENEEENEEENKNKEMFNPNSVYATSETVGDWDGDEETAAYQFNRIIDAIYEAAPDETYDTKLYEIVKYAWDDWGSDEKLLTLAEDEIKAYVAGWF